MYSIYALIPENLITQKHINLSIHKSIKDCRIIDGYVIVKLFVKTDTELYDDPKWVTFLDYTLYTEAEIKDFIRSRGKVKSGLWDKFCALITGY